MRHRPIFAANRHPSALSQASPEAMRGLTEAHGCGIIVAGGPDLAASTGLRLAGHVYRLGWGWLMARFYRCWSLFAVSLGAALLLIPPGCSLADQGDTWRVSVSSSGEQGNSYSFRHSISADGRYVAFASEASDLVPGDTNGNRDVFVHHYGGGSGGWDDSGQPLWHSSTSLCCAAPPVSASTQDPCVGGWRWIGFCRDTSS